MKTRIEKYRRYRAQIAATPENAFPKRGVTERSQTPLDQDIISHSAQSDGAIAYASLPLKKKKPTPYAVYAKKRRVWLIVKSVSFVLVALAMTLVYFFWVKVA
jgi:hypothetical protein